MSPDRPPGRRGHVLRTFRSLPHQTSFRQPCKDPQSQLWKRRRIRRGAQKVTGQIRTSTGSAQSTRCAGIGRPALPGLDDGKLGRQGHFGTADDDVRAENGKAVGEKGARGEH